jgi:hypothetical protein
MVFVRALRIAAPAAALAVACACSAGGGGEAEASKPPRPATTEAAHGVAPAPEQRSLAEILVPADTRGARRPYASLAELRWVARWSAWLTRADRAGTSLAVVFDGREESPAPPARAVAFLSRCATDLERIGPVPTTRLADTARATAEACERFEAALAQLEENAKKGEYPSEALFPLGELDEAARAFDTSVPGQGVGVIRPPFLDRPARRTRIQVRYTYVMSRLERTQITIRCFGPAEWRRELRQMGRKPGSIAGFVRDFEGSGNLAPQVCGRLDAMTYGKRLPRDLRGRVFLALAVGALTHEAQHAAGKRGEAVAECHGMQRIRAAARGLGATRAYAAGLAAAYWEYVYPSLPARYRHDDCRPGGRLDLRPASAVWP